MPYGFAGHIGIGKQTTWGTAVAATDYIEAQSESLQTTFERFVTKNIVGGYYEPDDAAGTQRNQGNIVMHGHPISMGHILNGAFGVQSTTVLQSGGLFKHDYTIKFSDQNTNCPLPMYTVEIFRDVTSSQRFSDVQFNTLDMSVAPNQELRVTAGMIARAVTNIAKSTPSFPSSPTHPFTFDTCSLSVDGVADTKWEALQITLNNQLEGIPGLDNTFTINRVRRQGPPMVRFRGTLEFQDITEHAAFIAQTEKRFVWSFTKGSSFQLVIDAPRVVYTAFPTNLGGRGRTLVSVDGMARYHVGSGNAVKVSLTTINTY